MESNREGICKSPAVFESRIFTYERQEAFFHARDFFIKACGFDLNKERHQKMLTEALAILEREKKDFQMKAVCSELGESAYSDGKIAIAVKDSSNGIERVIKITCNGFSRIKEEHVKGIFMCMITAGDWHVEGSTKAQVYMDTWGTAFVDGAKVLFENEIRESLTEGRYLSDPFGPGYYGMPSADTKKFETVLDASGIGIAIRESGIMVPLKSMAAIYLITDDLNVLPPISCSECFGRIEGCRSCSNFLT
ncbi:MAG: hypothetical protein GX663_05485 [Clostridiales bacterium]|nr:hypothetical protein [Clostridiales bacterium]